MGGKEGGLVEFIKQLKREAIHITLMGLQNRKPEKKNVINNLAVGFKLKSQCYG